MNQVQLILELAGLGAIPFCVYAQLLHLFANSSELGSVFLRQLLIPSQLCLALSETKLMRILHCSLFRRSLSEECHIHVMLLLPL